MFKLHFEIPPLTQKIDLQDSLFLLGSCFVDSIGVYLKDFKFESYVNPLGTLFNPISIFNAFSIGSGKQQMQPLARNGELYHSWDVHSQWSAVGEKELQLSLDNAFTQIGTAAKKANWIMITLGTAHVYELKSSGRVVANCHKFPQQAFHKRLLSNKEITLAFEQIYQDILNINPEANWLFTVSPVRHIKDGLVENNLSKAILIQSVAEIVSQHDNCHYFPAYEIMMDELRDYRFYKADMIHPNDQAIGYIWEAFQQSAFNEATQSFCDRWSKMLSALRHRPLHSGTKAHQLFLDATRKKLQELENMVDITAELEIIDAQIQA